MIRHIMADGSERKSILGHKVPINDETRIAYEVICDRAKQKKEKRNA